MFLIQKPVLRFIAHMLALCVLSAALVLPAHRAVAQTAGSAPTVIGSAPSGPSLVSLVKPDQAGSNPYDLQHLWARGDGVARATLLVLILMSMASWFILLSKLVESWRMTAEARRVRQSVFKMATLQEGIKTLKPGSAFELIARCGLEARDDHTGEITANIDRNQWIAMSVQRAIDAVQSRLQGGLAVLATVGSTAPFVGLFGTVWGILNALTAIGVAGQASIDKVAGPVGESLLMTAIGLGVAVPAVLGYNWLVRRNKAVMESVRGFGADVHRVLLGGRASAAAAN